MIGSDEFPFNDPFLDPKSRGRRGERKEGETQSSPFPTASPPSQLFLLRHSWTFHAPLKTALYLPLPRTRDVPLPRLLPVLGQKSSRSTGKKGRNKWLVLAFLRLFRFSPHSMYDDPLSNSRNLDSMLIEFAYPLRAATKVSFRFCAISRRFNFNSSSKTRWFVVEAWEKRKRGSRDEWVLNLGF